MYIHVNSIHSTFQFNSMIQFDSTRPHASAALALAQRLRQRLRQRSACAAAALAQQLQRRSLCYFLSCAGAALPIVD